MHTNAQRTQRAQRAQRAQRGIGTVTITMILVLLTGLVVAYANRNALAELRLSANEVRDKQAYMAASAGLDHALAYMDKGGIDQGTPPDGIADVIASNALTYGAYQVRYCDVNSEPINLVCPTLSTGAMPVGNTTCKPPIEFGNVLAFSCGWSDDNTAVRRITEVLRKANTLAGTVSTPLISKGTTNLLTGGASVFNYFNDLTVWTGQSILGQSNTGKTFINTSGTIDPAADYRDPLPGCNSASTVYTCSTQGSNIGHDTITGDTRLSGMTNDQFFGSFFGTTPTQFRNNKADYIVDLNNTLTGEDSTDINSIQYQRDSAIWVEGNVTTNLPAQIGTQDHPVKLIINGDLQLSGNTEFNGIVYVAGNVTGNGNPKIYGSLIVAGTSAFTGNMIIIYDPKTAGGAPNDGKTGRVPGTWRDW